MSCPKRPIRRRFLFWKYNSELEHEWKLVRYSHPLGIWELYFRCGHCGCENEVTRWNDESMLRLLGEFPEGELFIYNYYVPEEKQKVYKI
jgi:hypothetical protein